MLLNTKVVCVLFVLYLTFDVLNRASLKLNTLVGVYLIMWDIGICLWEVSDVIV